MRIVEDILKDTTGKRFVTIFGTSSESKPTDSEDGYPSFSE